MDDYAWENNLAAFRLYGPALEKIIMVSNGIDYWPNRLEPGDRRLVQERPGGEGSYHLDTGEGCDCHNVGQTSGWALRSYAGGKLWYSRNFREAETLDNGPDPHYGEKSHTPLLRRGRSAVSLVKIISLDANTHFNRLPISIRAVRYVIAAGIVIHAVSRISPGESYYAPL